MDKKSVIYTNQAQCQDCYRCLRSCPVKAIEMNESQAAIVDELCISCGTCIRECPQGAKTYRNDIQQVKGMICGTSPVLVSVAPSFAILFGEDDICRFAAALRKLGFSYISETSIGAHQVACATETVVAENVNDLHIASACPAAVGLIEKYHHGLVDKITPIVSPMVAHGKYLKNKFPEAKVVFIGPCLAKKGEAARSDVKGIIDAVLSFDEILLWLEEEKIDISTCGKIEFDEIAPHDARLFPLEGGLLKTADMNTDVMAPEIIAVSGVENLEEIFKDGESGNCSKSAFIEPLFCQNGCINGPLAGCSKNIFHRRRDLLNYVSSRKSGEAVELQTADELYANYEKLATPINKEVTEQEITEVLESTGKYSEEDELNCSACGYESCRDKAIAVIRGLAEKEMCIPYMRRLAEQRTDKIIETNPNGVVILDDELNILTMNPAFKKFFKCSQTILGKSISYLIDPEPFERLGQDDDEVIEQTVTYSSYNLICRQIIYRLPEEDQYVGIFVNITKEKENRHKLRKIRSSAVRQAQELLQHQVDMAQKMAQFLGESAAQGEDLVEKIMSLVQEGNIEDHTQQIIRIKKPNASFTDLYRKR